MDFDPAEADLSLAALFTGWALADEVQRRLVVDGFADTRFADGVVFQHLVAGPVTISALADRLGVTQQAASKTVADLWIRRYVSRSGAKSCASTPWAARSGGTPSPHTSAAASWPMAGEVWMP